MAVPADTSAWVEYDCGTGSVVDDRIAELVATNGALATTEPVIMEVLAGARSDAREHELRRLLSWFELLSVDPLADVEGAARIHRRCRRVGVTPRGLIDCLIANIVWRTGATLLAIDADLVLVAAVLRLPLDPATAAP